MLSQQSEHRLYIREHMIEDLPASIDWQSDPQVAKYLSWLPRSIAETEVSLREAIRQQSLKERTQFFYAIVLKDSQEMIGSSGFTLVEPNHGNCGWFLRRAYHGQGYATEAVKLLIQHAYHIEGMEVLSASCRKANMSSKRIMEKCGFSLVKESEDRLWYQQRKSSP